MDYQGFLTTYFNSRLLMYGYSCNSEIHIRLTPPLCQSVYKLGAVPCVIPESALGFLMDMFPGISGWDAGPQTFHFGRTQFS